MTVKPGNWYVGKITGEFKLIRIAREENQPVFVIETVGGASVRLTLNEMREEKPRSM